MIKSTLSNLKHIVPRVDHSPPVSESESPGDICLKSRFLASYLLNQNLVCVCVFSKSISKKHQVILMYPKQAVMVL